MAKLALACLTSMRTMVDGTTVEEAVQFNTYSSAACGGTPATKLFYKTDTCFKESGAALYYKYLCESSKVKKQYYTSSGCATASTGAYSSIEYTPGTCKDDYFKADPLAQGCMRMDCSSPGSDTNTYNTCTAWTAPTPTPPPPPTPSPSPSPLRATTTTTTTLRLEVFSMEEFGTEKCGGNASHSKYYATNQCIQESGGALYYEYKCNRSSGNGTVKKQYYTDRECLTNSTGANHAFQYKLDTCIDDYSRPVARSFRGKCKEMDCKADDNDAHVDHVYDVDMCKVPVVRSSDTLGAVGLSLTAVFFVVASVA